MWTTQIRFGHTMTQRDSDGFETSTPVWSDPIRASKTDITRSDQVLAMQGGYHVSANFTIHKANFSGADYFRDDSTGEIYDIVRTYAADRAGMITLTAEKRVRGRELHGSD